MEDLRATARDIFMHALRTCSVEAAFARHVNYDHGALRVVDDLYDVSASRVLVISFGKAAQTMGAALVAQLGQKASGIIAAPEAALKDAPQLPGFRYFAAGHPTPNAESIRGAEAALKALSSLTERTLVIHLISGGGSSLLEKPIDVDISLEDLVATYGALVGSGMPIGDINALRKHLSAVKGGRLAKAVAKSRAPDSQQVSIMVSDVPEKKLDALASGPTMPDSSSVEECYGLAERYNLKPQLPKTVLELFELRALEETPDKDDPAFHYSRWWPILSNVDAVKAAAAKAAESGFAVDIDNSCDDWEYDRAADHLLGRLRALRRGASRVCLISGGEVTVKIPDNVGVGGRNQQFALYCASQIIGENMTVLSAGTDGIDGNSPATGAVADGSTLARYSARGGADSLGAVLKRFDAYPLFASLADAIVTGPTGNNIRDLRILLAT